MIKVKVIKYDKNGKKEIMKMRFKGTKEEYLELEHLAQIAESTYIDEGESWR